MGATVLEAGACGECGERAVAGDRFCVCCGRALDLAPASEDRPVERTGRFDLLGVIGRGATATVYLAVDRPRCATVALKVLDAGAAQSWLEAEAACMRRVAHPAVAALHELATYRGRPAAVMERVEGVSLREVLLRHGPLRPEQLCTLLAGALEGLAHVHRQGVVHGDVKPDNIIVGGGGSSRLVDFGHAVAVHERSRGGSPGYLSPEAFEGRPVDERSDVFALGAVIYECLTGRRAERAGGRRASIRLSWRALLGLHPAWRALITGAVSEDAGCRPPDAEAVACAIRRATERSCVVARRIRGIVTGVLVATLALGVAAVWHRVPVVVTIAALLAVGLGCCAGALCTGRHRRWRCSRFEWRPPARAAERRLP